MLNMSEYKFHYLNIISKDLFKKKHRSGTSHGSRKISFNWLEIHTKVPISSSSRRFDAEDKWFCRSNGPL